MRIILSTKWRPTAAPLIATLSVAILCVVCLGGAGKKTPNPAAASEAKPDEAKPAAPKEGETAIRATADAFVKFFNAGDAKGVASLWTPNGTVADQEGNVFKGRDAIEQQYAGLFKAHPTARMRVAIKSIEFPTPTTAIEDGVAQVV